MSTLTSLLCLSLLNGAAAAPDTRLVHDFVTVDSITAAPWPDKGGAAPTSKVTITPADMGAEHPSALKVDYDFPSDRCTQVRIDLSMPPCENHGELAFAVQGDGSGNVLEVWTGEQARGWHGVGHVPLDSTEWREVVLTLDDNFTVLTHTLRFLVRRAGELGAHAVYLDDVALRNPVQKSLPDDFAVGPKVSGPPPFQRSREFRLEKRRVGDRTVALLDGEPLACVLDALPTAEYLELARRAGVNCFAMDLYWRDLEPQPGFHRWDRLRTFVDWLGEAGFGVVMLVNIHPPRWLLARCAEEPVEHAALYPGAPVVRAEFTRFLNRFLPTLASARNLITIGLSNGGEAAASFPEVPGTLTNWRKSPSLLADFRGFLRRKYATDAAWRTAWEVEEGQAQMTDAVPPQPLGDGRGPWTDFRRSWHDWREFADGFWVSQIRWQAKVVREQLPGRLIMVRFGWPVFQCQNVFLIRQCPEVDLIQCMDAVPTWEEATPWFLVSRAALYHGAVRTTDHISFVETDLGHNRGRPSSEDMTKYLPPLAPFIGGLWYYRGLHESFVDGLADALARLRTDTLKPTNPTIAVFYGQKYANWTQHHANYANEAALAGAARALSEAGLAFTVVSEYTLDDLQNMRVLILADNPILPVEAATAIGEFARGGGHVVIEDMERRQLDGQPCDLQLPGSVFALPGGFFASIQPRGAGLQLTEQQRTVLQRLIEWLKAKQKA